MFRKTNYLIYAAVFLILAQGAIAGIIDVQLRCNKAEYVCGEPVLLKTLIFNSSSSSYAADISGYGWSPVFGFTMYISYDGNDFTDIFKQATRFDSRKPTVSTPPLQYEPFLDRHCLPGVLSAGQKAERLDMLIFPKPGNYRLKAVLREQNDKIIHTSTPVEFRVLPLKEKDDSISQLGEQDFAINLGSSIFYAHYVEKLWGGYPPGKSLHAKKFEEIAPVIIENYKDSVFREYVMYADIMTHYLRHTATHELTKGRKELADRFVKEYPKSWLLPEVYRKLFWTHVAAGDKEKAEAARNKALQIAPHATVLKQICMRKLSTLE